MTALLLLAGCSGAGSSSSQPAPAVSQSAAQSAPASVSVPASSEPVVELPPSYGIHMAEPEEFVRETPSAAIAYASDGSYINMDETEATEEFNQQFEAYTKDAYQTGMTETYQSVEGGDKDASVMVTNFEFYDQQGYPALRVDYKVLMNNTTSFGTQIIINADRVYVVTLMDVTMENNWAGAFADAMASLEVITDEDSALLDGADASADGAGESQAA